MTAAALRDDHTLGVVFTHKCSPVPTSIHPQDPCNSALKHWFSNFSVCQNQLAGLLKTLFRASDSVGLGPEDLRFHRYPDDNQCCWHRDQPHLRIAQNPIL